MFRQRKKFIPNCQELVYGKRFDAGLKQAARQGGSAAVVWEQEQIQDCWKVILTELAKEQADYIGVAQEGPFKPEHYRY